jgi:NADPH-dependent curcumin reductase CurA
MEGESIATVIASKHPGYSEGDIVLTRTGWRTHALSDGAGLRKLDPAVAPITTGLGVLGMPGHTAYVGLLDIGQPKPGETVVVSAASGAVGSVVGQIAKIKDCRVVGIAGGEAKCRYVTNELGLDACVDHRAPNFAAALARACPNGIDADFENVGGPVLQAIWPLLNNFARVVVCGLIAHYNDAALPPGPDFRHVLAKRLTVRGFIILDHSARFGDFLRDVSAWLREGRIKYREDIVDGLEHAPDALIGMLEGRNFGKLIVRIGA